MTLVELMVSMAVFSLISIGLIYTHLFCLHQDQLVNSKLGASDQSRKSFTLLTRDIRSAKVWDIGNADASGGSFTAVADGANQVGNALWISYTATTNYNQGILYYFDTSNMANDGGKLNRRDLVSGNTVRIATDLTNSTANSMVFRAEDYRGTTQTDRTHKSVIRVVLEFAQYQYPLTKVGPGYLYDYYKTEFKLTSHVPDGP